MTFMLSTGTPTSTQTPAALRSGSVGSIEGQRPSKGYVAQIDEKERLEALHRLVLMDTPPEPEFDELAEFAATLCGVPVGLVTLLDEERQWFMASFGISVRETTRESAFCNHTVRQKDVLLVNDATRDPRFADNPHVTGEFGIRFYAGVPISSADGSPLGSLCVLDRVPRKLSASQVNALRILGRQVNARLELRGQRLALSRALAEKQEANARLAASEGRFQTFMDSIPFMSYLKDADGRFVFYNQVAADRFGVSRVAWLGKTDMDLFPAELAGQYRKNDVEVLRSGNPQVVEEITQDDDGSMAHWRSYKFPCMNGAELPMLGGISIDLTRELKQKAELQQYQDRLEAANVQLRELATTDPLTGLANRRVFAERLQQEFLQARRKARPLSVLLLDVDNFKQRNDMFGHDEGDACLRQLARVLKDSSRATDLVVRYGGEEFLLLLPETDEPEALQLGERIRKAVRTAIWPCAPVTVSGGVASMRGSTVNEKQIVSFADEALYAAKRAGKDRVCCASTTGAPAASLAATLGVPEL